MNEPITLMTYNIRSGRDIHCALHLDETARVITALDPDIVVLNEVMRGVTDFESVDQAARLGEMCGLYGTHVPAISYRDGWYGVGLLSRVPPRDLYAYAVPEIPLEERTSYYEPRVVFSCVITHGKHDIHVLGTHMGLNVGERRMAVQTVLHVLDDMPDQPTVLMGDFNAYPDAPELEPLFSRLDDTFSGALLPFTFPADKPSHRIDYIMTRGFHLSQAFAPVTTASDHLPLVARVQIIP